ncbi:uncharacterized protein [Parasteatoda tepidariorum]|uniref:uncharacterized protein n=1 Tax=Parasteatoda tepidariorum TaxID=114398 RepID=UPI001C729BBE|nr:uncharacterized protein LOC122270980 [Parasteatoda tepidariorum]
MLNSDSSESDSLQPMSLSSSSFSSSSEQTKDKIFQLVKMKPKVIRPSCPMGYHEDDSSSTPAPSAVNLPEAQIEAQYTALLMEIPIRPENQRSTTSRLPMEPINEASSRRNSYCMDPEMRSYHIAGTIVVGAIILAVVIMFFHIFCF